MNAPDTSTVAGPSSSARDSAGNRPTRNGDRFATVTANACTAPNPPPSSAVTVTVVVPAPNGVTRTAEPDTDTVATDASDDVAT